LFFAGCFFFVDKSDSETDDARDLEYNDDEHVSLTPDRNSLREHSSTSNDSPLTDEDYAMSLSQIRRNPSRRGRAPPERLTCTEDGMQTTKLPSDMAYDSDTPLSRVKKKKSKKKSSIVEKIDYNDPRRAPVMHSATGEPFYEVKRLIDRRRNSSNTGYEFFVKWEGYAESENTWEPADNLRDNCGHLMDAWVES